ncbi:hypothetical protein [Absidia glauca]|uniref:Reverse transcriptase domain-containing protein n=1 Tax=Absidia glauca TaxID=4829 RepID=A0A168LMF5_ABSGL|nr:hypothetical protein [Absidia glauca]
MTLYIGSMAPGCYTYTRSLFGLSSDARRHPAATNQQTKEAALEDLLRHNSQRRLYQGNTKGQENEVWTHSSPRYTHEDGPQAAVDTMVDHLRNFYSGTFIDPANRDNRFPPSSLPDTLNPFTHSLVVSTLFSLPRQKAPSIDSITTEILRPIGDLITPALTDLFTICWNWGYTPTNWRIAQVITIHKKGPASDPSNYRPISLTSVFRKLLEKCLHDLMLSSSPTLDMAQGGFRIRRSAMDQAANLHQLCHFFTRKHKQPPTLTFLDIKSAYDTLSRLIQHLFDDVSIVMQQNYQSAPFSPITGILQGSILSPHLCSTYINSLPQLVRPPDAPDVPETPSDLLVTFNCLLLYDTPIPHATTFKYLGIPFTHGGKIYRDQLIRNNGLRTAQSMFTLSTFGLNSSGYAKLLSVRLYQQFLRPQMECGLAITHLGKERANTSCARPSCHRMPTAKGDHDNHGFPWQLSHEIVTLDLTDTTRPMATILNRHPFAADQALFGPVPLSSYNNAALERDRSYTGDPHAQHPSEPTDSMAPRLADWWYPETMSVRHNHHQTAHHQLSPPAPSPIRTMPYSGPSIIPDESLSSPPSLSLHHCQMEAALADHPGRTADPGTTPTPRACRTSTCFRGFLPGLARPKSRSPLPQGSGPLSSSS